MPVLIGLATIGVFLVLVVILAEYYPQQKPVELKIATIAMECGEDLDGNIRKMNALIDVLTTENPNLDLIVFGEMTTSGYSMEEAYINEVALEINDDRITSFQEQAASTSTMICFGFAEREGSNFYNSQMLIDKDGSIIGVHRKHNLTKFEDLTLQQGLHSLSVYQVRGLKIGLTICYDVFAKSYKAINKAERPNLLIHSLADPQDPLFTTGFNGRSSNAIYLSANRYGSEGKNRFSGHISVVSAAEIIRIIRCETSSNAMLNLMMTISNQVLKAIHLVIHWKHVIKYLKWDRKMRTAKKENI